MRPLKHLAARIGGIALLLGLLLPSIGWGEYPTAFSTLKEENCRPYAAEFQRIAVGAKDDPAWEQYERRLAQIDRTALLVIADCETFKAVQLRKQTGVSLGDSSLSTRTPTGAARLLDQFSGPFAAPLPRPSITPKDQAFLQVYYSACISARLQYVFLHGQAVAAADPSDTRHILELCMVFPFFQVNDDAWTVADIAKLPNWMKPPANLRAIEAFAIQAHRLHTAFEFRRFATSTPPAGRFAGPQPFIDYLVSAANLALQRRDDSSAAFCLRTGIALANAASLRDRVIDFTIRLSELIAAEGDAPSAAQQIKAVLDEGNCGGDYGRLAMLRLKDLDDAGRFREVVTQAAVYQQDQRFAAELPRIQYLGWLASQQLGADEGATQRWGDALLKQFPDHPLGAEIVFGSALQALASNRSDEASKLLQYVEYHYPQSRVVGRAREIEARLNSLNTPDPARPN